MRPSLALLAIALAGFAISIPAALVDTVSPSLVTVLWGTIIFALAADLLISPARRHLSFTLTGPREIEMGETAALNLEIRARRRLPQRLTCRLALPDGLSGPEQSILEAGGREVKLAIPLGARRRGQWQIGRLWLGWRSSLGLLEFTPSWKTELQLAAVPNLGPLRTKGFEIGLRSDLFGARPSLLRGEGSEFHQLRDFTAGMDSRTIDWKHSARHKRLLAKEMRAERNHHVILALDNGALMREEIAGLPKIDHAVNAALVTAWAALLGGDLVGLYAYDSRPRLFVPPEGGRRAFATLRTRSAALSYRSVESNPTLGLTHLLGRIQRRSMIVVFSDFVDTTTAELMVENIAVLARHHLIVFVALRDPAIEAAATQSPAGLGDVAEAVVAGEMLRERQRVFARLARLGVSCLDVPAGALTGALLAAYLRAKSREMI